MTLDDARSTHDDANHDDWALIIDALTSSAIIFDKGLTILAQNRAHEEMTGTRRDEVVGTYMFDSFPPDPTPGAPSAEKAIRESKERVWSTLQADTLPLQEHALQSDNGIWTTYTWKVTHAPLLRNGKVIAILQTSENVTTATLERTMSDAQKLAAREAANISYFAYEMDSDRFIRDDRIDDMFGFEPSKAGNLAAPFIDRIHADDLDDVLTELQRPHDAPLGTKAKFDARVHVPGEDDVRLVRVRGTLVLDPVDSVRKLVGVFLDMTDVHRTQQQLEQLVNDKDRLLIEVNHRVKNSLQLASSILSLASRNTESEEAAAVLATANSRIDAIAEVHGGIYIGGDVTRAPTAEVLTNIVDGLSRSVGAGDTTAKINVDYADFALPTDQAIAFGLLINELLTNAIKYGGDASARPVILKTAVDGKRAQLEVSNDSQRPSHETDLAQGTGVGTALIEGFVRQLRGTLNRTEEDGRYIVCVDFDLPD